MMFTPSCKQQFASVRLCTMCSQPGVLRAAGTTCASVHLCTICSQPGDLRAADTTCASVHYMLTARRPGCCRHNQCICASVRVCPLCSQPGDLHAADAIRASVLLHICAGCVHTVTKQAPCSKASGSQVTSTLLTSCVRASVYTTCSQCEVNRHHAASGHSHGSCSWLQRKKDLCSPSHACRAVWLHTQRTVPQAL